MDNKLTITNRDLYEEIQEVSKKTEKLRHQVKSRWYYIFWGTCTVAVCAGQVLVGSGFRRMAESFEKVLDTPIELELGVPRLEYDHKWEDHPYDLDEDGNGWYHPTHPPTSPSPQYKEDLERSLY